MRHVWLAILICGCLLANGLPFAPLAPAGNISSLPAQALPCCCRTGTCRMAACPGNPKSASSLRFAACAQSACSAPTPPPPQRAALVFLLPASIMLPFQDASPSCFPSLRAGLCSLSGSPLDKPPQDC
ncbi:MAG TPA: hypothetical protein VFA07_05510 [Chthonomonadaceae bacterium]|nr:hypothetical protein [Chthonomonadaceae bacterium]